MNPCLIPAGYLSKRVVAAPESIGAPIGADVYSVSGCISESFADYIPFWRHNGYWLFDRPEIIHELAAQREIDLSGTTLFYYEVFEQAYVEDSRSWVPLPADLHAPVDVRPPAAKRLAGFDVVTFSAGTSPECSPLTCCGLAAELGANGHCLFDSFDQARQALESSRFANSEPGPFRIFAVYTVP
jgi:hypothetical protein